MIVLCGAKQLAQIQRVLKDYRVGGGSSIDEVAGLRFQSYEYMGKKAHFAYYELFDDPSVVPAPTRGLSAFSAGTTSGVANFSDFSIWLDMGEAAGEPLIKLVYKSLGGISRKFIHSYVPGIISPEGVGGRTSNSDDAFQISYFIECGLKVKLPNRLGILRAES